MDINYEMLSCRQVLANVAEIILAESEEGAAEHNAWRDVFVLVEPLCCAAIMFPIVWCVLFLFVRTVKSIITQFRSEKYFSKNNSILFIKAEFHWC